MDETWRELYESLGMLVVGAAGLEESVRAVLLNMLGGPHWRRTELVVEGFSAAQMRDRCERLAYLVLGGALQDDVVAWLRRVEAAQSVRNRMVHSHWASKVLVEGGQSIGPAAMSTRVGKPSKGLQRTTTAFTAEEIRAAAAECTRVMVAGYELIVELQEFSLAEGVETPDTAPWIRVTDAASSEQLG